MIPSTSLMNLASACASARIAPRNVAVIDPGRDAAPPVVGLGIAVPSFRCPFGSLLPPFFTVPSMRPVALAVTAVRRLPDAVRNRPPLAVAPWPPTEVILPALSLVILLTPR